MSKYTIGLDFGTQSVRALVVNAENGDAMGIGEGIYHVYDDVLPCGVKLPPRSALADPEEYLSCMEAAVKAAVKNSGVSAEDIIGMGQDSTSCSIVPCNKDGVPLCAFEKWKREPHAYIRLWKSYTATEEAEEIGEAGRRENKDFMVCCGGYPSSEGVYPKMLETARKCPELYEEAYAFVDLDDFINWQLTGELTRSVSTMGAKFYCADGRTLPEDAFFEKLHPLLANASEKLKGKPLMVGEKAGVLTETMAKRLGLKAGIPVATGMVDGYSPAISIGLHENGDAVLSIGTSGVLDVISDKWVPVSGICGQARDVMIPGFYGYDFCQSGVGDMFNWFVKNCVPARIEKEAAEAGVSVHNYLSKLGFARPVLPDDPVAVDWWNGSRCLVVDQTLTGAISGLRLSTAPDQIYRALVEAAAFGMRAVIEHAEKNEVKVGKIRVCGGIAAKNPLLVQCYADIFGRDLFVSTLPNNACAGSAIAAAAAAGIYETLEDAMGNMAKTDFIAYHADMKKHEDYEPLYKRYLKMRADFSKK